MSIFGLSFPFKILFQSIYQKKLQNVSLRGPFCCVFDVMFIKVSQFPKLLCPEKLLFLQNAPLCSDSVLNTSLCLQLLNNLYSDFMLCTASDTFRILVYSALFFFRYMQAYSVVFSVIKAYSSILRHYYGIFRLIQAYSAPCVSLTYLQPCHILSPCIFRTRGLFKTL